MDGAAAGPSWPAVPPSWPDAPPPPVAPPAPSAFWSNTATTAPAAPLDPSATASASAWLAPARPPKPRRERSHLGLLTFSALLVAVGVAALLDAAGTVDLSLQAGLAVALLVVGAGLIAGAWYGRSRGLIALGLLLTLLASFVSIVDVPMRGGTGDVTWRLTSADELAAGYHLRAGSAVLDLTAVPFGEQVRTVDASVGFGQLTVVVPDGVSVRVTGHIGAGDALIFGQQQNGFDLDIDSADDAAPQLVVTTHIGFGELQVRHVAS
jgi:hypothetical protein